MKSIARYIIALTLFWAYTTGVVGVSVYHCHCAHSNQVVWLSGDEKCECSHTHGHDGCEKHNHDETAGLACCAEKEAADGCCTTVVKTLQTDQNIPAVSAKNTIDFGFLISLYQPLTVVQNIAPAVISNLSIHAPPTLHESHSLLALVAQWRL